MVQQAANPAAGSLALAATPLYKDKYPFAAWLHEDLKEIRNKPMGLSSRTGRTAAAPMGASRADSGKAAGRQRLAEALRANLGRRKAQKRDRASKAEAPLVGDEVAQRQPALSEESNAARSNAGPSKEL
jgi:hypothetical protein